MESPSVLFQITCTTCQARLNVRSEAAIGAILTCPKCGSMVQVVAPPDWSGGDRGEDRDAEPAPSTTIALEPETVAGASPAFKPEEADGDGDLEPMGAGSAEKSKAPPVAAAASAAAVAPPAPAADTAPPVTQVPASSPPPPPPPPSSGPPIPPSPAWASPSEALWRKWVMVASAPAVGLVVGVAVWMAFFRVGGTTQAPAPIVERVTEQDDGSPVETVTTPPEQTEPLAQKWFPDATRLHFRLPLGRMSGQAGFDRVAAVAGPAWTDIVQPTIQTLQLQSGDVKTIHWAATDLKAWARAGVAVIELATPEKAAGLASLGEATTLELAGSTCRRVAEAPWPHPFVLVDETTVVTAPQELLDGLVGRTEPQFTSPSIDLLLGTIAPEADLAIAVDLDAARTAGWRLPASLLDVWPAGRQAWHTVWEVPQGIGLGLQLDDPSWSEIRLVCEGETTAAEVEAAMRQLVEVGKKGLADRVESITDDLQAGRMSADVADRYEMLLKRGQNALEVAKWKVIDRTVRVRTDWGVGLTALAVLALDSRPAIEAGWYAAARRDDAENHRELLNGLSGYRKAEPGAEERFPPAAHDAALFPPETRLSWIATMLPYYGHRDWHRQLQFGRAWNSPQNRPITRRSLPEVVNPALGPAQTEAGFPVTHYVGVAGIGPDAARLSRDDPRAGVFGNARSARLEDIVDGASNTIALLGVSGQTGPWASGGNSTLRSLTKPPYVNGPDGFGSGQPNGMLAAMADGSVRFISEDVDPRVIEQLATIRGGERVDLASLEPATPLAAKPQPKQPKPKQPEAGPIEGRQPEPVVVAIDVEARLSEKVPGIELRGMPLADLVRLLEQLTGVAITLDADALVELGISPEDPVTTNLAAASVAQILDEVLAGRRLAYVSENGLLLITRPPEQRSQLVRVPYAVEDLTGGHPAGVRQFEDMLHRLVAPETWRAAGGRGTLETNDTTLLITQSPAVHDQIVLFCEKLRSARGLPLRSRFDPKLADRWSQASAKLQQPVTVNFDEPTPLRQIVAMIEQKTGTRILVNWWTLAAAGVPPDIEMELQADDTPLGETFRKLVEPDSFAFRPIDGRTFEITSRQAVADRLDVAFYRAADLVADDVTAEQILERIRERTGPELWTEGGGPGVLHFDKPSGRLIALQSQPVHRRILALLNDLRPDNESTPPKPGGA